MASEVYTSDFYKNALTGSYGSAQRIVPLVLDLMRPRSVLDVGCGLGHFLKVFSEHGVPEIQGIDGTHVPRELLVIEQRSFIPHDVTKPFDLGRRFDLVVSLEVAEHLPADAADDFVARLVKHGPAVMFSAALPAQGGTGHVNERWLSYWIEKFGTHGFRPLDVIRPAVWARDDVEWWYRQNCVLFAGDEAVKLHPGLAKAAEAAPPAFDLVHPQLFALKARMLESVVDQFNKVIVPLSAGGTFKVTRQADGTLKIERA